MMLTIRHAYACLPIIAFDLVLAGKLLFGSLGALCQLGMRRTVPEATSQSLCLLSERKWRARRLGGCQSIASATQPGGGKGGVAAKLLKTPLALPFLWEGLWIDGFQILSGPPQCFLISKYFSNRRTHSKLRGES